MSDSIHPIIAIVGNVNFARYLSDKFARKNVYFAIIEEPWIKRPDKENEIVRRNNLLSVIKHRYLILAGCKEETCKLFIDGFPEGYNKNVIIIKDENDFMKYNYIFKDYFNSNNIDKQYVSISQLDKLCENDKLAVIEESNSIGNVIAENFCVANEYKIMKVGKITKEMVENTEDLLREWNNGSNNIICGEAKNILFDNLRKNINGLDRFKLKQVIFFTKGIPYGILPFNFPTAHLFLERDLGLQILKGYIRIIRNNDFNIAMICDPGKLPDNEISEVKKILLNNNIEILELSNKNASVYKFMHLIERYPFDFMMLSSHAGEVEGRRINSEVISSNDTKNIIVYDLYPSFAPIPGEKDVIITEMIVPISLNGILWSDKANIKNSIDSGKFNMEDIRGHKEREHILHTQDCVGVKFSNALRLNDFTWIPAMHVVGETRYPIVINNACSSWIEMANRFIFAGASAYIGTTKDIISSLAKQCGTEFINYLFMQESISGALFKSQKDIIKQLDYSPYLYWGHPDIIFDANIGNSKEKRDKRIQNILNVWQEKLLRNKDEKMKKKIKSIIECIKEFE